MNLRVKVVHSLDIVNRDCLSVLFKNWILVIDHHLSKVRRLERKFKEIVLPLGVVDERIERLSNRGRVVLIDNGVDLVEEVG